MAEAQQIAAPQSVHDVTVQKADGSRVPLSEYAGQVLLIVNTASFCGFTPQYNGLKALQERYQDQPFQVLGFPSDNFMNQEYGSDAEVQQFCETQYSLNFPIFSKINVKNEPVHPLFQYLNTKTNNGRYNAKPKWNFTKYLVDQNGRLQTFFLPITKPTAKRITQKIESLL
jgi:glutathione peroxidase